MQTPLSWIAPQADSPSVGVVHVVLAIQPDRLSVQLDGLFVLLGGKVLVAKPACRCDAWYNSKSRNTVGEMINEPVRKIFRSKKARTYFLRPVEVDRPAREETDEDSSTIQDHPLIVCHRSSEPPHTSHAASCTTSQPARIRGTPRLTNNSRLLLFGLGTHSCTVPRVFLSLDEGLAWMDAPG